eukprot:4418965-Prorocentrum_lima.AAC.1
MTSSLVGSEMCIRDSTLTRARMQTTITQRPRTVNVLPPPPQPRHDNREAVSYTHLTLPTICSV